MCGVLGGINIRKDKFNLAKTLLQHRGPDDTGDFLLDNLYLYHVRLGIQDIANGKQPFNHSSFTIIFNGEIYNHLELRSLYNLDCKTKSDTETILLLYEKIGLKVLDLLDGMFVFAIFDANTRDLTIVRDRAGEKPIYIYRQNNEFAFSSELNSLRSLASPEIEYNHIFQYLRYSFLSDKTPYKNIFELPAGSWYRINIDSLLSSQDKWWNIDFYYQMKNNLHLSEAIDKVDELLESSIKRRLSNSELEVGTFLSGGIDSGLVTAIASRLNNKIKTFTIAFEGQYDESGLASLVAKKYNTIHTKINISFSDLKDNLEKILTNYGEPFSDSSAIPSFYVSREAKKHLTVILNGDGADELFGGYRRYVPYSNIDFLKRNNHLGYLFKPVKSILPFPSHKKSGYNYLYRFIDLAGKGPVESYLSATIDSFEGYERNFISYDNPFTEIQEKINYLNKLELSGLKKIMCLDFNYLFANDLLIKMDIATMAHSLEGRTPFLSKDILEFAPSLADNYKIRGLTTKFILRELAKKYLPDELISQPKRGFEVPLLKWIDNDLKEFIFDYLSNPVFSGSFFRKGFVQEILEKKIPVMPEKRAKMLWTLVALEVWYRKCYRQKLT